MKKIVMLIVVFTCMIGCDSRNEARVHEFKDICIKMGAAKSHEFEVSIERFKQLDSKKQEEALESARGALLEHNKITAMADLKRICTAVELSIVCGKKVKTIADLVGTDNYLKELPRDPWGNEYRLRLDECKNDAGLPTVKVVCAGPDGRFGTNDDIHF